MLAIDSPTAVESQALAHDAYTPVPPTDMLYETRYTVLPYGAR
jgi:hypothetical protein